MKKLTPRIQDQLEFEIVTSILKDSALLKNIPIELKYFDNFKCRKIMERVFDLQKNGENVDFVSVGMGVKAEYLEPYFLSSDDLSIITPNDFLSAVKNLKELYVRKEIERKVEESGDAMEVLRYAQSATNILAETKINKLEDDFKEYVDLMAKRNSHDDSVPVTSWANFNEKIQFERGDLCLIGARPSVGKTAFCLNLAIDAAKLNSKVLFISLEMSLVQLFHRILAHFTRINARKYKTGEVDLKVAESKMLEFFKYDKLKLLFKPNCQSTDLFQYKGYDLIVVDYLQLLSDKSKENENIRVSEISRNLKKLAGENNCVVIAAAQLNRDIEKSKRLPNLSDLRSSGALEQDADIACLLHREDLGKSSLDLILAKNRNGEIGRMSFDYAPAFNIFTDDGIRNFDNISS